MDIFISYRRDGGRDMARSIQLALKASGYTDVFFDFNSLRDGVFNEQIIDAINECKDFLLILSKGSMDRCANERDWVAREIKTAIDAGCKIIPVLVESEWDWPESFPKTLNIIKSIQFTKVLNDEYFDDYMKRLIERLDSKPNVQKNANHTKVTTNAFFLKLSVDETVEVLINNERVRKIKAGKTCVIDFLERGKTYSVSVRSLAIKKDIISFELAVPLFSNEIEKNISFGEMRLEREKKMKEESDKRKKASEIASFDRWKLKENRKALMKQYDFVDTEYEDVYIVGKKDDKGNIKYGMMDEQGFEIVQCVFDDAAHMKEGLAAFYRDGQWSYYDKDGVPVLENVSEIPGFFICGAVPVCRNGKYGLMAKNGHLLVPCENECVYHSTGEFVVIRKKDKEVYLFTHKDGILKRVAFDGIKDEEIVVSVSGKCIANVPVPLYYPGDRYFITKGELKGLLDKDGQILIRCSAQEIMPMDESLVRVRVSDRYGVFDVEKKKTVIPVKYKTLIPIKDYILCLSSWDRDNNFNYYCTGLSLLSEDNSGRYYLVSEIGNQYDLFLTSVFGIINSKDEIVIPMEYLCFTTGFIYGSGILCFKQIACEGLEYDDGSHPFMCDIPSLREYRGAQLFYFVQQSPFPENSPLRKSKIKAVFFQQERPEESEWRPVKTILYDKGQYKEYGMDGASIERQVVTIEEEIAWLVERGYKRYEKPQPFDVNNCVKNRFHGELGRFCEITINGRFGVGDEITGLMVLPADYMRIERIWTWRSRNEENSIEIKLFLDDDLFLEVDVWVLSDNSVWIEPDSCWRYSEEKREELARKYLPFLFKD